MSRARRRAAATRLVMAALTVTIPAAWLAGRIRRMLTIRKGRRELDRVLNLADLQDAMGRVQPAREDSNDE